MFVNSGRIQEQYIDLPDTESLSHYLWTMVVDFFSFSSEGKTKRK